MRGAPESPPRPSAEEQKQRLVQHFNPQTQELLLGLNLLDPEMVGRRPGAGGV